MSKILEAADGDTGLIHELRDALHEIHERLERLEAQMADRGDAVIKAYTVGLAMGQRLENPQPDTIPQSRSEDSSGLVERVEAAIELSWGTDTETVEGWTPEARAAIEAVAEWLEEDRSNPVASAVRRSTAKELRAELEHER